MSDQVRHLETLWSASKSAKGEDHYETRNLLHELEQARKREEHREYMEAMQRADDALKHQNERLNPPERSPPPPKPDITTNEGPNPPPQSPWLFQVCIALCVLFCLLLIVRSETPPSTRHGHAPVPPKRDMARPSPNPSPSAPIALPRITPPDTSPVWRYGTVRDDLLNEAAEVEFYIDMLYFAARADGKTTLSRCLRSAFFSSPASTKASVQRLWRGNAATLEEAIDREIVAPCRDGSIPIFPDGAFPPPKKRPNIYNEGMRVRAGFRALRYYASEHLNDTKAADCLAREQADMAASIDSLRKPSAFITTIYKRSRSGCAIPPNGPAEISPEPKSGINLSPAAALRVRLAHGLHTCSSQDEGSQHSCIEAMLADEIGPASAPSR